MKIKLTKITIKDVEIPKSSDLGILIDCFTKLKIPFTIEHQHQYCGNIRFAFQDIYNHKNAFYFTTKFKKLLNENN